MELVDELIASMCARVPAGRTYLNAQEIADLRNLTGRLVSAARESEAEHLRYLEIRKRSLAISMDKAGEWVKDRTILVTGGSGCVGSALIRLLSKRQPRRLVSVSRGVTRDWPRLAGAEYIHVDVRDRQALASLITEVRPDVLFHVAAQRDPGLAEQEVHRTVTTNVLGTHNVIAAAEHAGVPRVVLASTGKTVIPYTPDIYASSKRIAEWLAASAAGRGHAACSAARFTHLVDNSIVHQKLLEGCKNGLIRLHDAHAAFYVQSAVESAQLLMCAALDTRQESLGIHAINDLGWPFDLLSLALGALGHTGSNAAIYFSGYDLGYRSNIPFPGQYSPSSWQLSPLINAFDAESARRASYQHVDIFPRKPLTDSRLEEHFLALQDTCMKGTGADPIRNDLDALSWAIFEATLDTVPVELLLRIRKSGISSTDPEGIAHPRILAAIEERTN